MATYRTQIQWGGPNGAWDDDADLVIEFQNRLDVAPATNTAATGTILCWSGPNGSGSITFFNDATSFLGSVQFPGEGPLGYRGWLKD
jgi:hypothetical protein